MLLSNDALLDVFRFVDYASVVSLELSAQRLMQVAQSNHKVLARQRTLRATFGYGDDCLNVQIYEETTDEEREAFDEGETPYQRYAFEGKLCLGSCPRLFPLFFPKA